MVFVTIFLWLAILFTVAIVISMLILLYMVITAPRECPRCHKLVKWDRKTHQLAFHIGLDNQPCRELQRYIEHE
jgi:hypothetical protein